MSEKSNAAQKTPPVALISQYKPVGIAAVTAAALCTSGKKIQKPQN